MSAHRLYTAFLISFLPAIFLLSSCKKFTEIDPPKNGIVTAQTFGDDASANAAITGIYTTLNNSRFGQGYTMAYLGLSADELTRVNAGSDDIQMQTNTLAADNSNVADLWKGAYNTIAQANACLEGLTASSAQVSSAAKTQFVAEAKFIRAYCNFYLVSLFGDIPLLNSTNWQAEQTLARTSRTQIFQEILQDLNDAQTGLPATYPSGHVIRATQWAATALLARVKLYQQTWADAEKAATDVIDHSGATLTDINSVFLIDSKEAIWQLQPPSYYQNTFEGSLGVNFGSPNFVLADNLTNAFETGDQRMTAWVSNISYNGQTLYYAYKYKANTYVAPSTEYYMMLRLAELYLVRAEARAQQNNTMGAVADLNLIRERAGLADLSLSLNQSQCLLAVEQERRVELFCEWGHRWLDLNRTGRANVVLPLLKPKWTADAALYPIPANDRALDNQLTQNPGYN